MQLKGKVAIITGSSRGIGKAYALALAREGAKIVVAARSEKEHAAPKEALERGARHVQGLLSGNIQATAEEVRALGSEALPVRCDVTKEADVEAMVAAAMQRFGRIDILINNAAIYPRYNSLEIDPEDFMRNFRVNTLGPYLCAKHVLPHMIKQKSGNVVCMTSKTSMYMPIENWSMAQNLLVYATTKAGVNRMVSYLAGEMRDHGIAVNALVPGMIRTQGLVDAMPEDYDYSKDKVQWHDPTPEHLGPAMVWLVQQTPKTWSGQVAITDEFKQTWGPGVKR
ncbi:MAG: SDR family oxidoreductase [Dehalococcoidia bacterium]|nr:SDR family oxidoreductase [Dehalococcoidia bacterium]